MMKNNSIKIYHRGDYYSIPQISALCKSDKIESVEINVINDRLSGTRLLQLASKMRLKLEDLVDQNNSLYKSEIKNGNYDEADWVAILVDHPELLKTPIAETNNEAVFIHNPTDVLKLRNVDLVIDSHNHSNKENNN